jgi:hypothetical protein
MAIIHVCKKECRTMGNKNCSSRPRTAEKVTEVPALLTIIERQNSGDAIPYTNLSLQTTGQREKTWILLNYYSHYKCPAWRDRQS